VILTGSALRRVIRVPMRPVAVEPIRPRSSFAFDGVGDTEMGAAKRKAKGVHRSPEQLWRTDPARRPINVLGIFTGTLAGGEDEVIAVAQGGRTSFKNRTAEDRATIRGGLAVLNIAGVRGYGSVNVESLSSKLVQGKQQDQKLIRAAGGGNTLKAAANHIRGIVSKHGLDRAAWGARGIYILANLKGFAKVRHVAAGVSAIFGPIGMLVGAAVEGHGAISAAVAKKLAAKFNTYVTEGIESYKAKVAKKASTGEKHARPTTDSKAAADAAADAANTATSADRSLVSASAASASSVTAPTSKRTWLLLGGAVAGGLLLIAVAFGGKKSGNQPARSAA